MLGVLFAFAAGNEGLDLVGYVDFQRNFGCVAVCSIGLLPPYIGVINDLAAGVREQESHFCHAQHLCLGVWQS